MTVSKRTVLGAAVVAIALLFAGKASHASYEPQREPERPPPLPPTPPVKIRVDVFDAIKEASNRYGVPVNMALAVAKVESNFKPNAVSPKGASGLFQLMPYPKGPAVSDAFDVVENSNAGNRYLARLYKKYGNWPDALAAYNWGPGNMDSDKPIPSKVQAYVDKVMSYSEDYA